MGVTPTARGCSYRTVVDICEKRMNIIVTIKNAKSSIVAKPTLEEAVQVATLEETVMEQAVILEATQVGGGHQHHISHNRQDLHGQMTRQAHVLRPQEHHNRQP
jgi:hypothetical protein